MFGSSKSNREGQLVVDALIGNQVVIRGDVEFSGGLYVEGRIHGKVIAQEGASGAQLNGRLIHASAPMAALPAPEADEATGGKGDTAARRKLAEAMA